MEQWIFVDYADMSARSLQGFAILWLLLAIQVVGIGILLLILAMSRKRAMLGKKFPPIEFVMLYLFGLAGPLCAYCLTNLNAIMVTGNLFA